MGLVAAICAYCSSSTTIEGPNHAMPSRALRFWRLGVTMVVMGQLLTTGQAARLLGSSRQHVVDLCDRGELRFVRVGAHRRIDQGEIERALGAESRKLSRAEERSLWLHRALLARLVVEPEEVLAVGRANLERLIHVHGERGMTARWLVEWGRVLAAGVDAVADVATSLSGDARELRQNSPFAGVISQDTRAKLLSAFARHWRAEHAA